MLLLVQHRDFPTRSTRDDSHRRRDLQQHHRREHSLRRDRRRHRRRARRDRRPRRAERLRRLAPTCTRTRPRSSRWSRASSRSRSAARRSPRPPASRSRSSPARRTSSGTRPRRRPGSAARSRPALQFEKLIETMFGLANDGKTNKKGLPNPLRLAVIANHHFDDVRLPFPPAWMQKLGLVAGAPDRPPARLPPGLRAGRGRPTSRSRSRRARHPAEPDTGPRCTAQADAWLAPGVARRARRRRPAAAGPRA